MQRVNNTTENRVPCRHHLNWNVRDKLILWYFRFGKFIMSDLKLVIRQASAASSYSVYTFNLSILTKQFYILFLSVDYNIIGENVVFY